MDLIPNLIHIFKMLKCRKSNPRFIVSSVGLGGLGGPGVPFSPGYPRFAGSNPAEVDGFFQGVKILSTSPPGGTLSWESRV